MPIESLITGSKTFETVRDQIVSILAVETASQQALATAASADPDPYAFRVFLERANPIGAWTNADDDGVDTTPIVNVSFSGATYDGNRGDTVKSQAGEATYHIDVYAFGQDTETVAGHQPADETAMTEAARVAGLVHSILMAAPYTYLALRTLVRKRWIQSVTMGEPRQDERATHCVGSVRLTLGVTMVETSPQYAGEVFESMHIELQRSDDGSVYALAQFDTAE